MSTYSMYSSDKEYTLSENSTEKKRGYSRIKIQTFHKPKNTSKEPRSPWRNFVAYHTRGNTRDFNQGAFKRYAY